jgi:hypothetical protein
LPPLRLRPHLAADSRLPVLRSGHKYPRGVRTLPVVVVALAVLAFAAPASAFSPVSTTVSPKTGGHKRAFTVSFVARDVVGDLADLEGSSYTVELAGRRVRTPCDDEETRPIIGLIPAGYRVTVRLRPDTGGWCRGRLSGTVTIVDYGCREPSSSGALNCGLGQEHVVGRFSVRVR